MSSWQHKLSCMTKDTVSTIAGCIVAGAAAASAAYLQGQVTKEALCASAIIGIAGWFFKRGSKETIGGCE